MELYKEFQEVFLEDMMYWMPGVQMVVYSAYNSDIAGIEMPGEYWVWNNAYLQQ